MISQHMKRLAFVAIGLLCLCYGAAAQNPVPIIYQPLAPAATRPGGPGFTLTVNGTGFVSGAVVDWNGSARETTFVSSSQVTAAITAADIANAGTAVITVSNPAPGGGTSNWEYFQITVPTKDLVFKDVPFNPGMFAVKVVVGDFNGDGKPDVVELGIPNLEDRFPTYVFQILLGNGDGTFQAPATIYATPNGVDFAAADVNGDGKLDLVGSYSAPTGIGIFVFLGNGDGTFQPPIVSEHESAVSGPFLVADVNGDGIVDLVGAGCVGVELGNGDGTFRTGFRYCVPNPNGGFIPIKALTLGDFHKNGKLDIVAAVNFVNNGGEYALVMLPGNGDGTFGPASVIYADGTGFTNGLQGGLESLVAVDLYGDGNLDLAWYYLNPNSPASCANFATDGAISSMRGNGDGTFQQPLTVPCLPESFFDRPLVPGDFNGDGHLDLAAKTAAVLLWTGGGPDSYNVISTSSSRAFAVAAADFNGDGRLDLIGIDDGFTNQNAHLLLQAADFVGSINPQAVQRVGRNGSLTYTISVESVNGFAGRIELSASQLPRGVTATFAPQTLLGSGTSTVTITTNETPTGSYLILLTGTAGSITHSGGVRIEVGPPGAKFPDFGGSIDPVSQTVAPGSTATYAVTIFPINGLTASVRLSVSGLPPGATAEFSPAVIPNSSGESTLTVTTSSSTPVGRYHLIIASAAADIRHTDGMLLTVGP